MSTGWNRTTAPNARIGIINLLGNEYWLERNRNKVKTKFNYKPTGK